MASKRVDEYSTATPADADQAIAIDASDTTDSSAGTVKRFVLSDLFTYVLNKILARVNTWAAVNTFTAGSGFGSRGNPDDDGFGDIVHYPAAIGETYTASPDPSGSYSEAGGVYSDARYNLASKPGGQYLVGNALSFNASTLVTAAAAPDEVNGVSGATAHAAPIAIDALRGAIFYATQNGGGDIGILAAVTGLSRIFSGNVAQMAVFYAPTITGSGTTRTAAILVADQGSNYALYTGTGPVHFGGDVSAPNLLTTAAAAAAYQPLDSDLTAIAALSTTAFGRALLALADASALRTAAGTVIGTDVQAFDTELSALAGLVSAANKLPYFTGSGAASLADFTAAGRALVDDADASAQRTTLGLGTAATADTGTAAANVPTITQADARYQPLDSDLTAIAALSTTAFGRSLLAAADAAALRTLAALGTIATQDANNVSISGGAITGITDLAVADGGTGASTAANARTNLGLVIGTDVEAHDATLTALAGVTTAADKLIYATGSDAFSTTDLTSTARSLLDDTTTSAMRTTLGLAIGADVQAQDAELAALAGLTSAADKLPYFTGSGTATTTDFTTTARSLLDDTSVSAMRTTLGAATEVAQGRPLPSGGTQAFVLPGVTIITSGTNSPSTGQIRYQPIMVRTSIGIDQIACEVQASGVSAHARLGLYTANTNWQPVTLIGEGEVDASSNGVKTVSLVTTLAPGRYLLAINTDVTITLRNWQGGSEFGQLISTLGASALNDLWFVSSAYGAFNASPVAWTSVSGAASNGMRYYCVLRVATP
jgi:hypothetical protein